MQFLPPSNYTPEWLRHIDGANIATGQFPLADILRNSLFYPFSEREDAVVSCQRGNRIMRLFADKMASFVFSYYGTDESFFRNFVADQMPTQFEILASLEISEAELTPSKRDAENLRSAPKPSGAAGPLKVPFCTWFVLKQKVGEADARYPERLSLLLVRDYPVAAYRWLFAAHAIAPACVAVVRPQSAGVDLSDNNHPFAHCVLRENPAGPPEFVIHGGKLPTKESLESEHSPFWPCWQARNTLCEFTIYDNENGGQMLSVWAPNPRWCQHPTLKGVGYYQFN